MQRGNYFVKITDVLSANRINISCELFPPKEGTPLQKADGIIAETAALSPSFISVTCGAAGGNRKDTAAIARSVAEHGALPLAHMTCVASTYDSASDDIDMLLKYGVRNIMALRGDIVGDAKPGDFKHASDLVTFIKQKNGDICIGGACYPEGHPESGSIQKDIENLKFKLQAGVDFLITQLFFDNSLLYRYIDMLHSAGVNVPVIAGIMPITSASQVSRLTFLSGSDLPSDVHALINRYGSQPQEMKKAGIDYAVSQISDLISHGVTNIHVYTMNKPDIARDIFSCFPTANLGGNS